MTVVRTHLGLVSGYANGETGWGGSMNANLDAIDANAAYNVTSFATVADAIAAVPSGGRLYFPMSGGPYTAPSAAGWTLTKPIEIFGDGGQTNTGTLIRPFAWSGAGNKDDVVFNIQANGIYIHDIRIDNSVGYTATAGTGDYVRFDDTTVIARFSMERVGLFYPGRSGVRFVGNAYSVEMTFKDVTIYGATGPGFYLNTCNVVKLDNVLVTECLGYQTGSPSGIGGSAYLFYGCSEIVMDCCTAEQCGDNLANADYDGYIHLSVCHSSTISSVHIEDQGEAAIRNGIILNVCRGTTISSCGVSFPAGAGSAGSKGIHLVGGCKGCMIGANEFNYCDSTVKIDAVTDIGNTVMPQSVNSSDANAPGEVIIPAGGRNFAFMNDLTSGLADNKGVGIILPSHPDETAIDASVVQDGLLVYNSATDKLMLRAAGGWVALN